MSGEEVSWLLRSGFASPAKLINSTLSMVRKKTFISSRLCEPEDSSINKNFSLES